MDLITAGAHWFSIFSAYNAGSGNWARKLAPKDSDIGNGAVFKKV
jgi:hypothetical protein